MSHRQSNTWIGWWSIFPTHKGRVKSFALRAGVCSRLSKYKNRPLGYVNMADENLLSRSRSRPRHDRASLQAIKSEPHSNFVQTLEFFVQTSLVHFRIGLSLAGQAPLCALKYIFISRQKHVSRLLDSWNMNTFVQLWCLCFLLTIKNFTNACNLALRFPVVNYELARGGLSQTFSNRDVTYFNERVTINFHIPCNVLLLFVIIAIDVYLLETSSQITGFIGVILKNKRVSPKSELSVRSQ